MAARATDPELLMAVASAHTCGFKGRNCLLSATAAQERQISRTSEAERLQSCSA